MSKVLFVNGCNNAKSYSHQIASVFVDEYEKRHKDDEIETLNLYEEDLTFLDVPTIKLRQTLEYKENQDDETFKYVKQFLEADKIIIAAPFWNLSIPAILHAYLEHIAIDGVTYQSTLKGSIGLCQGKKIVHIVTRGIYSTSVEYGDSYLRAFFASLGIKDFRTIALEGTKVHQGQEEAFFDRCAKSAKSLAEVW
ncbi:MAG: NAD(P)H-dependent oxidoreductase [Clostridia bacterium]|nr:NAD(P)H-dependent oxidoreductase [Clostridia bacterium]